MRDFVQLYERLDSTTSTNAKVDAMVDYFRRAEPADSAWAIFFLTGRRLKRFVSHGLLRGWAAQIAAVPDWLFQESYDSVGDLAETIALLLPEASGGNSEEISLDLWMRMRILPLRDLSVDEQFERVRAWWAQMNYKEVFVLNKILTGELRVGVSQSLVERALAKLASLDTPLVSHRLMGTWEPSSEFFQRVISPKAEEEDESKPYPFYLASPLEAAPSDLGDISDWQIEWKWDGIRAQLIRRRDRIYIWSRGEDLVTDRFPELVSAAEFLPADTALDGEILPLIDGKPAPFALLQTRIGRKKLNEKILREAPVSFIAYDILEFEGKDIREEALSRRRKILAELMNLAPNRFHISETLHFLSWDDAAKKRTEARSRQVEGFMLKRKTSPYLTGRKRGDWWKWKVDPFTLDTVLMYAQPGHGRRANLLTDYTFGIWKSGELVPIAKAYSGLTDQEITELNEWIRENTVEKFGPVRSVKPSQVFEIAFEAVAESKRHKSGFAVRFPRIARWRLDKPASEADSEDSVRKLLRAT